MPAPSHRHQSNASKRPICIESESAFRTNAKRRKHESRSLSSSDVFSEWESVKARKEPYFGALKTTTVASVAGCNGERQRERDGDPIRITPTIDRVLINQDSTSTTIQDSSEKLQCVIPGSASNRGGENRQELPSVTTQSTPRSNLGISQHESFAEVKRDKTFTDRIEELRKFKSANGHCNVPQSFSSLGIWVKNQRYKFKLYMEGKPSSMDLDSIGALEELGFAWKVRRDSVDWEVRINELKHHISKHGNCNVPRTNPSLAKWVDAQRHNYKLFMRGKTSQMTSERIDALNEVGFAWKLRNMVDFEERLQELKKYRANHGHCNVPQTNTLGRWVMTQRLQFRLSMEGKQSRMTPKRVSALNELGFVWSLKGKRRR